MLRPHKHVTLIATGGTYQSTTDSFIGPNAEGAIRSVRASKCFPTAAGVSTRFGLSATNPDEIAIKQAMVRSAREVILLADYTVFGQDSVMSIGPLAVAHKVVTDNRLDAGQRLALNQLGIEVIVGQREQL